MPAIFLLGVVGKPQDGTCITGFHLTRKQFDNLPSPEEAHKRRGADWTFNADQFLEAIWEIRHTGWCCGP